MLFYYSIFVLLAFFSFIEIFCKLDKGIERLLERVVILSCIIISSLINDEFGDLINYKYLFNNTSINDNLFSAISQGVFELTEPLYGALNYAIKILGGNFRTFLIFEACFVNILIYYIAKNFFYSERNNNSTKDYIITIYFIMWCLGLWNIIIIRQTLAVALCWYSIRYIIKKRKIPFYLCVASATLIHASELFWIPAYYIYNQGVKGRRKRYRLYFLLIIFCIIGIFLIRPIANVLPGMIGRKVRSYISHGNDTYGLSYSLTFILLKTFFNIFIVLILAVYLSINLKHSKTLGGIIALYTTGAAIVFCTSFVNTQLSRLAQAYTMVSFFIFPYIFKQKLKIYEKEIFFVFFISYMAFRLYISIHGNAVLSQGYPFFW